CWSSRRIPAQNKQQSNAESTQKLVQINVLHRTVTSLAQPPTAVVIKEKSIEPSARPLSHGDDSKDTSSKVQKTAAIANIAPVTTDEASTKPASKTKQRKQGREVKSLLDDPHTLIICNRTRQGNKKPKAKRNM
ncbi:MAG TPA: hypothetical protein VN457_07515, partial [Chlamydiales bacterium]|nr:hypothetical protein [Chlamydiales bacterium]